MQPCIYILGTRKNGALCVRVTGHPLRRVWEHKFDIIDGCTTRYAIRLLVHTELHPTMAEAISRDEPRRCSPHNKPPGKSNSDRIICHR